MKSVPGHFDGSVVELLDEAPSDERGYVLVTFLDRHLEVAVARGQRSSRDVIKPPLVSVPPGGDIYRRYTVGALMTREVATLPPTHKVTDALHMMRAKGITSVVVEAGGDSEWGIVTMRDVLKLVVATETPRDDLTLAEIASRPLIYVSPDMSLRDCARLLLEKNIRRAVVKQSGRPVGIISDTDIFLFVEERGWGKGE
ncbi:MAG: CBS domain-containing protein [Chloroflexaceae bacterium]|jgi:isocitrate dehydrogenase|nr:CBS domain-containing protein [Chloroflexaceae bacterium]